MMEIISPTTDVTKAFNSAPLRFNMCEPTKHKQNDAQQQAHHSCSHSPSPSPPGLECAHNTVGPESELSTTVNSGGSPVCYPKASSASTLPYPSPPVLPPLDLSSVPTTPEKTDGCRTETPGRQPRPASAEMLTSGVLSHTVHSPSEAAKPTRPSSHHSRDSIILSPLLQTGEEFQPILSSSSPMEITPSKRDRTESASTSSSTVDTTTTTTDPQLTDWKQMLHSFAAFCQGKVKHPNTIEQHSSGESLNKKPRPDCDNSTGLTKPPQSIDPLSQFQAMFLSMGQMLFNTQSVPLSPSSSLCLQSKSGAEEMSGVPESNRLSTSLSVSDQTTSICSSTGSQLNSSPKLAPALSVPVMTSLMPTPTAPSIRPSGSTDLSVTSQSPLEFTASLFAMIAAQNNSSSTNTNNNNSNNNNKSIRPPHPASEILPFGPTGNFLLPNPFTPNNSNNNNPFSARVPAFPNGFTNPNISFPFLPPQIPANKLLDNRELLYQLGQQLMAMAAASGTPPELGSKQMSSWSSSNTTCTASSSASTNNSAMDTHHMTAFSPFLPNPAMAAMMSSNLFGTPSTTFPPMCNQPSGPTSTQTGPPHTTSSIGANNERKSSTNHLLTNPSIPGAGSSLSGISMRGNQKYSAYYQHQRKQGFHPQMTADYAATGPNARRQGTALTTTQLSGGRYASRRFRGGSQGGTTGASTHASGLDVRGTSSPRLPGVRGAAVTLFPGFRCNAPYTTNNNNIASVTMTTATTMANNIGAKHILTNGGAPPPPPSPSDPMQMGASAACGAASSSTGPTNPSASSESTGSRHRDTAFLCSCGQDFESLYVFTLHMKDTGHKPKSDQSERDIPKLVRGQDMWINSETEQTREILRCMRCHQSFRNLPELTMHMMKTNHYSEIVYNDSGRLVFVNPDDPHHPHSRRGSVNPGGLSGASPSKSTGGNSGSGHWLSRRGSRGAIASNSGSALTSSSTAVSGTTSTNQDSFKRHSPRPNETTTRLKADLSTGQSNELRTASRDSQTNDLEQVDRLTSSEPGKAHNSNVSRSSESSEAHNVPCSEDHTSIDQTLEQESTQPTTSIEGSSPQSSFYTKAETVECSDRTERCPASPTITNKTETNVLRQIETFVENSLPRTPKSLTVKVDHSGSMSSSSSTPSIDANSRYSYSSVGPNVNSVITTTNTVTSDGVKPAQSDGRKRTHSETSLSLQVSPVPSPSAAQSSDRGGKHQCLSGDSLKKTTIPSCTVSTPPTPGSPGVTSTTNEFSGPLRENPLSSLQKLVETTHKPVPPCAAFSTPPTGSATSCCFPLTSSYISNSLFVSCAGSCSKTTSTHSTMSGGPGTVSGRLSNGSTGHSSGPRSLSSPMDMAESPFASNTTSGHSPGSQFAPIILPANEGENIIPALSALYAYVEKSSSAPSSSSSASSASVAHSHDRNTSTPGNKPVCPSPNTADEKVGSNQQLPQIIPSMDKLSSAPALQAIYAAAMSSLAAQYLQQQQQKQQQEQQQQQKHSDYAQSSIDPLEAFKQAASSFKTMFGDSKPDGADAGWLKMLQLFTGKLMMKPDSATDLEANLSAQLREEEMGLNESRGRMKPGNNNTDLGRVQSKTPVQPHSHHNSYAGHRQAGDMSEAPSQVHKPDAKGMDSNTIHSSPSQSKFNQPTMDSSSYVSTSTGSLSSGLIYSNSLNAFHPHLPNVLTNRYPTTQGRPVNAPNQPQNMMTTMITKKAKCHFCGKPFANKGQVRLHISKNKCPCLLQQSCHVAALAAAFGSDNSHLLTNTSSAGSSKPFLKDPMLAGKGRTPTEDFLASLTYTGGGGGGVSMSSNPLLPNDSAPSALSLLKERFQNFDLSHSPLRSGSTESKMHPPSYTTTPGKSMETSDSVFSAVASTSYPSSVSSASSLVGYGNDALNSSHSTAWPFGPPQTSMSPLSTALDNLTTSVSGANNPAMAATAAANAGQLAAMALLAQTLVQLTTSQATTNPYRGAPPVSTGSDSSLSFADPTMAAAAAAAAAAAMASSQLTSRPVTTTTSSASTTVSPATSMPFFNPMTAFNFDLLLNQTALMKQLSAIASWPDRSENNDSVSMPNPFQALTNCCNTAPNGLP